MLRRFNAASFASQVSSDSGAGRRESLLLAAPLVHGHDFGAAQHPREVHLGQDPGDGPRRCQTFHARRGGGKLFPRVVRFGVLCGEGPLRPLVADDDDLLAAVAAFGGKQQAVVGPHKVGRQKVDPAVQPLSIKMNEFLIVHISACLPFTCGTGRGLVFLFLVLHKRRVERGRGKER